MKANIRLFLVFYLFLILNLIQGQIMISSGEEVTPIDLVESILEEGVQYFNVQYQGAEEAKGIYSNGDASFLGKSEGIILSSGYAEDYVGPNDQTSLTGNFLLPGDSSLSTMGNVPTFDAATLSFSFIPESDSIKIKYVLGSEEYPDIYGNSYDIVAIFLSGPNPNGGDYESKNIAIVPESDPEQHISVATINNETNEEYYVDNADGLTLQYDGFTIVLTAKAGVVPCEIYNVKIVIADAADMVVDSGVSLEENTITFPEIEIETISSNPEISENMIEGCTQTDVVLTLSDVNLTPVYIYIETLSGAGYAQNGVDYEEIGNGVYFPEGEESMTFSIIPYMDNLIEGEELVELVIVNEMGCYARYDTVTLVIQDYYSMIDTISPPMVMCQCQDDTLDVWVQVSGGIPPYSYVWEPGGQTTDSILVSPDTTTKYIVTYTDQCQQSGIDSTFITVFPTSEFETYYFEAALNPGLSYDIYGEVFEDSVYILLPPQTNPNGLIASFTTTMEWIWILVGNEYQEPGVTPNDFTNPIMYEIWTPGGHMSEWTVVAELEMGNSEIMYNDIQIFPNPAKDQLSILNANGYKVSLISNLGIEVYSHRIEKEKQTININQLESGIYYLNFENGKEEFVRKFVIEK